MAKFQTEIKLSRELTLMDATLIGVGAMIGAGIFVLTGIAAGVAGPALIIAFALNGFVALLTAMSYAELGSCYHDAGGGYLWVKEGLPKWNGFISGWMSWFAHAVACSLYALGFGAYLGHVLTQIGITLPQWGFLSPVKLIATCMALLFGYINFRGAAETGKVGNFVTTAKIIILIIFIGFGLQIIFSKTGWQGSFEPFMPNGWSGVFKAMGLTFIAFQGFEVIAQSSEEIINPKKNIPRAIFLSLLIVIPIYLLVAFTALGSVNSGTMTPWDYLGSHKETALVEVASTFFYGGLISTMSALNATVYSSSRVAFAMGRDRNFPAAFSKVHSKKYTPHVAIAVSMVIIVIIAVSLPIEDVASAADIMFLLLFLQVNIALIRLRKKRPDLDRGFITPFYPWLSIVGIALLLFLAIYMFSYSLIAWLVTGAWIAAGLLVYRAYASKREVEHVRKIKTLQRIERKEYRVLLCLSNPQSVASLTGIALAVARKHSGEIIILHVIEVHEGEKLAVGNEDTARVLPLFEQANKMIEPHGVAFRNIVKVSHRISQSIVQTAIEEECNFIIIARQKNPSFMDRVFSSLIDTIMHKSTSEIAVLHGELPVKGIKKIMIPIGENIHTNLAAELAPALADYYGAELSVAVVFDTDLAQDQKDMKINHIDSLIRENKLVASIEITEDIDVMKKIVDMTAGTDLLLMGGRSGDLFELLLGKSLTQDITEKACCPVLWVKEYEEKMSVWSSIFRSGEKG